MLAKIRRWFLDKPVWLSVACVVLCSVGGSVGAMFILGSVVGLPSEQMFGRSLAIATTVPALVSLPVSLVIIRLLREVDAARQSAQDLAWNGVEPYGVCAVRTLYSAETRVQSTRFVCDPATEFGARAPHRVYGNRNEADVEQPRRNRERKEQVQLREGAEQAEGEDHPADGP